MRALNVCVNSQTFYDGWFHAQEDALFFAGHEFEGLAVFATSLRFRCDSVQTVTSQAPAY